MATRKGASRKSKTARSVTPVRARSVRAVSRETPAPIPAGRKEKRPGGSGSDDVPSFLPRGASAEVALVRRGGTGSDDVPSVRLNPRIIKPRTK
jgi:hypothetical protein